jgi:hypothetical protein
MIAITSFVAAPPVQDVERKTLISACPAETSGDAA